MELELLIIKAPYLVVKKVHEVLLENRLYADTHKWVMFAQGENHWS